MEKGKSPISFSTESELSIKDEDQSSQQKINQINRGTSSSHKNKTDIDAEIALQNRSETELESDLDTNEEIEEVEEKENFLFRNFHKFTKHLEGMGMHYPAFFKKEEKDDFSKLQIKEMQEITRIVSSAFHVPFYFFGKDLETNRKGIPVILSALRVKVIESTDTAYRISSNTVFEIDLDYANNIKWRITRRLLDFVKLHSILAWRHLQGHLPRLPKFPPQSSYLIDLTSFKSSSKEDRQNRKLKLALERRNELEQYLQDLCYIVNMNVSTELCEFLEISSLSISNLNWKGKEGYLKNRIFDVNKRFSIWDFLFFFWKRKTFKTQWFLVRDSYIAYVDFIDQSAPSDVLLVDKFFQVVVENEFSTTKPFTVTIYNGAKKLEVRPESDFQMQYWLRDLNLLKSQSEYAINHRYDSFAPMRENVRINWFVDGERYFNIVAEAINRAETEIFIHGWWVSPELFLKRPPNSNAAWRLDSLLYRKAIQGIKIYVLIYKEITMTLPINSHHTKSRLESLHPNIKVQRHPDHFSGGTLYWAHHEKIVVVDQQVAFVGGLDLCYGRFDNSSHTLSDISDTPVWTGLDYSNPRVKDFRNVQQHEQQLIDRNSVPRMPWHDVHCQVYGQVAKDISRHFIQRWNFIKAEKSMHKEEHIPFLLPKRSASSDKGSCIVQVLRSVAEWSTGIPPEISIYECYIQLIKNSKHFVYIENQFFISKANSASSVPVRNRIVEALVDRIVKAHNENQKYKVIVMIPLLPAFESDVNMPEASSVRIVMQGQYSTISRGPNSIVGSFFNNLEILLNNGIVPSDYIIFLSLRKYGKLVNKIVTEQIYIHSKLLIVDDEFAVVGSANLNDRSMLGIRDSEIALIIQDTEKVKSTMDGFPYQASKKVFELRMQLFREHFGLCNAVNDDSRVQILSDPLFHKFWEYIKQVALDNTIQFRDVFRAIPDDLVTTWDEYKKFIEPMKNNLVAPEDAHSTVEKLSKIQGHVVLFPTEFMKNEDLVASVLTPEFLLPVEVMM